MMMLALLLLQTPTPVSYHFPEQPCNYAIDIKLKGFIPLFGANEATAELQVGLKLSSQTPDSDNNPKATATLDTVKILLNGSILPFGKETFNQYFPLNVTLTPQGKVVKNNSPDIEMPVHLPGLDIKHVPEITYLAIEFPAEGIQQGKSWTYTRQFKDSDVTYTVTPTAITGDTANLDVSMTQDYEDQEGDAFEVAKNPKDATYNVKTHVEGKGKVVFDLKKGLIRKFHLDADAAGNVTNIETKAVTKRDLKTNMDVDLKS